jgi:tetratricopeptide (TPR) repeat protein
VRCTEATELLKARRPAVAERETMNLLAEFFGALNEEVARAGVQKKQLATVLGLSASSVTEMFTSGRAGNKTPPSWERVERILRFCWAKRDHGDFPGMTEVAVGRALKEAQARYLQDWRTRHAILVRDIERARGVPETTSPVKDVLLVPAAPEVRYSLPPDAAAFTGRGEELNQVTTAVADAAGAGGVVAVGAIDGMPGVGKTALAVHAAHVLQEQFPDRQLFVDLHAHTPGREPVRPQDALAGLLTAVGVDPRFLPGDLDGRTAMWRDKMAGKRALLVLDNVASTSQAAPLLPGQGGCLVLVTSRRHLGDLPGTVTPVLLDVLPPRQAEEMFVRLAPRAEGSPAQVAEMVQLAGFLPLAISLLARVFARHPSWTLADLAAETQQSLLTLTAEHTSIAAAFEVSYGHLDPIQQRFFCLLGLHPGTTTDGYAAAALAGISLTKAAGLLDGLHGEGLLTETGHRRYGMHDLLRRYARDHAAAVPADDSRPALARLLDYYQHTADRADARLARRPRANPLPIAPAELLIGPDLADEGQALTWARADRASLLACLDHVTATGQHARIIALTAGLAGLLRCDGPWADAITRDTTAIQAAQHLGDRLGQANALNDLGTMRQMTGDYMGATEALEESLDIYRDVGNRLGQANALNGLGMVRRLVGDHRGATQALEESLDIYRDVGNRLGQATALHNLGTMLLLASNYPDATEALEESLDIYRNVGNRLGQGNALSDLGNVLLLAGDYPGATQALQLALNIYRDLGDQFGQVTALNNLGNVLLLEGDYSGATQALQQALNMNRDLGNKLGQAGAFHGLGTIRRLTGDYPGAAQALQQALNMCRDLGYRHGEAEVLNEKGTLHRIIGEPNPAKECHQQALDLARAIPSSWLEAHALAGLGRCDRDIGDATQAETLLRNALEIFQRIGAVEVSELLAELEAHTGPHPSG